MGIILKFLGGKFGAIALFAVGALLVGSMGTAAYQHQRAARYQSELASKQRDVDIAVGSSKSKDVTIAAQNEAIQKWVNWGRVMTDKETAAVEQAKKDAFDAFVANQKLRQLEKVDYEKPDCIKYMAIDVASVCSNHALGVRQRAGGDH